MCSIHMDIFLLQFELHLRRRKKVRLTPLCSATETEFCCILFDSVQPLKLCSVVFCLTVYSHVIEISDFPMEFQTRDLMAAFKDYT